MQWCKIAHELSGRTDNAVKNFFFCSLRKVVRRIKERNPELPSEYDHVIFLVEHLRKYYLSESPQNGPHAIQRDKYVLNLMCKSNITKEDIDLYVSLIQSQAHSHSQTDQISKTEESFKSSRHGIVENLALDEPHSTTSIHNSIPENGFFKQIKHIQSRYPEKSSLALPMPRHFTGLGQEDFIPTILFLSKSIKMDNKEDISTL